MGASSSSLLGSRNTIEKQTLLMDSYKLQHYMPSSHIYLTILVLLGLYYIIYHSRQALGVYCVVLMMGFNVIESRECRSCC